MLALRSIRKTYPSSIHSFAIRDLNLEVKPGEILGLIGKSGAGKSTVLRMMNLLERPDQGQVMFEGQDLTTVSEEILRQKRQQMGMIFQHFNLLNSRTVFDNIALPLEITGHSSQKIKTRVQELLSLVNLDDRASASLQSLSGGQRQRVAIARALATHPKLLLSDEATSALDPESKQGILDLLRQIHRRLGLTLVLVTHEMEVIKQICERVALIDQGKIVELSSVIELFAHPKTDLAKRLTRAALHLELPAHLYQRLAAGPGPDLFPLVRFTFVGNISEQPLLSLVTEQFGVEINVFQATLERFQDTNFGVTVGQMMGAHDKIQAAMEWLRTQGIPLEIYGYVPASI